MASSSSASTQSNNNDNNSSSSLDSGIQYPAPISAKKLSPYVVGSDVVLNPPGLDASKIKIVNLFSANVHPPSWAEGYDEIVAFLWYHPFGKMLIEKPDWVFQDLLCEFWATCAVEKTKKGDVVIRGTILNGKKLVHITENRLRSAFELAYMDEDDYAQVASHTKAKNVLSLVDYTGPLASIVKMKFLNGIWNYLLSTICKTLQMKADSFDQPNVLELQLFHSMVTMTRVDYAKLIFRYLVGRVTNKTFIIPYGRVLALIIEVVLDGDYSLATGQTVECKAINTNIFNNPKVTAQGLTQAMQIYLDFCRTRDREQQELEEAASPSTRSESDTQSANQESQGT